MPATDPVRIAVAQPRGFPFQTDSAIQACL